ncbi:MAG: translation initiation factor IF-6 [Candidatus Aenigmarchaeota archaeon]|nr:translation initiation factor IF-6 [Candidatus Aenigmarchaeota archaeon]
MTPKRIERLDFQGNSFIGLFSFASDSLCIIGRGASAKHTEILKAVLKVDVIETTFLGTELAGIFVAGNSRGVIVSDKLDEEEIELLKRKTNVLVLSTRYTALGNLILCNDSGCIISDELEKFSKKISDFLKVTVKTGTIDEINLVGSLGVCTNKGCLVHKNIRDAEKKRLEDVLKVPVDTGTVNFGSGWVRSGLVANSNGFIAGKDTSGPEMGNAAEAFGFV